MVTTVNSLASDLANLAFELPLRGEGVFLNKTDLTYNIGVTTIDQTEHPPDQR